MDFMNIVTEEDVRLIAEITGSSESVKDLVGMPMSIVDTLNLIIEWLTQKTDEKGDVLISSSLKRMNKEELESQVVILLTIVITEAARNYAKEHENITEYNLFKELMSNIIQGFKEALEIRDKYNVQD